MDNIVLKDKYHNEIIISKNFRIMDKNKYLLGLHIGIININEFRFIYFISTRPRDKDILKAANTPNIFIMGENGKAGWIHIYKVAQKLNFNFDYKKLLNEIKIKCVNKVNDILIKISKFNYIEPPLVHGPQLTNRIVICNDALETLDSFDLEPANIFTGMPDNTEMKLDYKQYGEYRKKILKNIFELGKDNILVFTQTDKKATSMGIWYDKISSIYEAANEFKVKLIFHKIGLYHNEDTFPDYQHYICFSNIINTNTNINNSVMLAGDKLYKNGTPFNIIMNALMLFKNNNSNNNNVLDPFCGRGTNLALANLIGMNAIGIDIDPVQCEYSRNLNIEKDFILNLIKVYQKKNANFQKILVAINKIIIKL